MDSARTGVTDGPTGPLGLHRCGLLLVALLTACGVSSPAGTPASALPAQRACDLAPFPSAQWTACEVENYAKTLEAPLEQLHPAFVAATTAQALRSVQEWTERSLRDPSWLLAGNLPALPLCASGTAVVCVGDPFRYPQATGPDGATFYDEEAEVSTIVFYDRNCARLSAHVWKPRTGTGPFPGIVITNGSIQAPETSYWWAAQALVRAGYAVLSYDPRGQGLSDLQTPRLQQGSNLNPRVFWENQVDAIDFFHSTPDQPYPHSEACAGTYPTVDSGFNPQWRTLDRDRLGIAGHSLGAIGVSVVQGYGTAGADPWPGRIDTRNPVKVAVGWDSLVTPSGSGFAPLTNLPVPQELADAVLQIGTFGTLPAFGPRVPALVFQADYGLAPVPYLAPPDPESNKLIFRTWQAAGLPVMSVVIQGTTHFDFSQALAVPATSWCPHPEDRHCAGGWGSPAIAHYTVAWFDRWLKRPGEPGYADADTRLLDDDGPQGRAKLSHHYRSARDFPDHNGRRRHCEDLRAGC